MDRIKQDILDSALITTYDKYIRKGKNHDYAQKFIIDSINKLIKFRNYDGFTREKNARDNVTSNVDYNDALNIIINKFVDTMLSKEFKYANYNEYVLQCAVIATYNSHNINQSRGALSKYINEGNAKSFTSSSKSNENFKSLLTQHITPDSCLKMICDIYTQSIINERNFATKGVVNEVNKQVTNALDNKIENFAVYPKTINQCREDIQNNSQFKHDRREYNLDDMYAVTDVGRLKSDQEDSVLILQHPKNKDFKMMVVADGMGGHDAGEIASSFITTHIMQWFEAINPDFYKAEYTKQLEQDFQKVIMKINSMMYDEFHGKSGSTFVGAIVNDSKTIISNVGDSRAYVVTKNGLEQVTDDHSISYEMWKHPESHGENAIKNKDDIMFHRINNQVFAGMGFDPKYSIPTHILDNNDYKTLLLFSDGVTDCLTDGQLMAVCSQTPKEKLAEIIVEHAKTRDTEQNHLDPNQYCEKVRGGKDNLSAVVYDNER